MARRLAALVATLVAASAFALAPLEAAPAKRDYAAAAWSILPPGENGSLTFDKNTRDQAGLYDALTPLFGDVSARDIRRMFKPAPLGAPPRAGDQRERPRPGVSIYRDSFGVAHVTGKTEADVAYGAGLGDRGRPRPPAPAHPWPSSNRRAGRAGPRPARARAFREDIRSELGGRGIPRESARRGSRPARGGAEDPGARQRVRGRDQRLLPREGDTRQAVHRERRRRVRGPDRGALRHERRAGGAELDVPRRPQEATRRRRGAPRLRRPSGVQRYGGAGERARVVPATGSLVSRTGERPHRRRQLRRRVARAPCLRVERAPRRRRSGRRPGTRSSSPARRSATSSRGSSPRSTSHGGGFDVRGARVPGRAARPHRPRPRLRVERDVLAGRHHRPVRRDALRRRRSHYLYRGQCEPMRRSTRAR